jgi:hypothetical protein
MVRVRGDSWGKLLTRPDTPELVHLALASRRLPDDVLTQQLAVHVLVFFLLAGLIRERVGWRVLRWKLGGGVGGEGVCGVGT